MSDRQSPSGACLALEGSLRVVWGLNRNFRSHHKDTSVACQVLEVITVYFHSESLEPQMRWCDLELSTQAAFWPHRTQSEIKVEMGVNSLPGSLLCWSPRVFLPDLKIWGMRTWKSKYVAGKPKVITRHKRQSMPQDGSVRKPFT